MNILYLISILLFFGINISNGMRDYIFVARPLPFSVADGFCKQNYGTRLATVKSPTDNHMANVKCPSTCYIGINDMQGEGQFKNLDGSPALYTNWAPREPNNFGNEDCVEMTSSGKWNDISCGRAKPFLCDKPGAGGSPPGPGGLTPTFRPTNRPTFRPTFRPTDRPVSPTFRPTFRPTDRPASVVSRDYVYVSIPMTFDGASAYCKNRYGTKLGTIKTPMDNARADAVCTSKCYIGVNDRRYEGYFTNSDGTRVSYFNWSPGEPNNVGNEDCVEIYAGGKWNDISCYSRKAFICDKPGASSPVGPRNYVYISSPKTFYEAQSYCRARYGTSLAIISNPADNSRAASQCRGTRFPYNQCFIGLNDRTAERQWKNIDGSPATYFNWNFGEPNNVGNEDCVEILSNGKMNDLSCSSRRAFLCNAPGSSAHQEKDIETNDIFNDNNIKNVSPVEKTGVMVYFIGLLSGVVLMMIMAIVYVACKGIISNPRHKTYQYKSVTPKFTSDEDTSDVQSDA